MKTARPEVLHHWRRTASGPDVLKHRHAAIRSPRRCGHRSQAQRRRWRGRGQKGVHTVVQEPQLGTGHALLQTEPAPGGKTGTSSSSTATSRCCAQARRRLLDHHRSKGGAPPSSRPVDRPYGYGRIVRDRRPDPAHRRGTRRVAGQRAITEINGGVYAFELDAALRRPRLHRAENAQAEYYLPDLVGSTGGGAAVETLTVDDAREFAASTAARAGRMGAIVRQTKNQELMAAGVTLIDPATTYIDADVGVGPDTVLHPNVYLEGARASARRARFTPAPASSTRRWGTMSYPQLLRHPEFDRAGAVVGRSRISGRSAIGEERTSATSSS